MSIESNIVQIIENRIEIEIEDFKERAERKYNAIVDNISEPEYYHENKTTTWRGVFKGYFQNCAL